MTSKIQEQILTRIGLCAIIMKKVVVIGIDGASPDLMEPWMNEGKLPNFEKIRKNGTWGKLNSTIPPFSAPAWASIVTGCNPGKHGIYGFESTTDVETHLITSQHRRVPAIWNYLTDIGLKSVIVNVPGSYPPEKINGAMITGLLTPSSDSNFTYPKDLKKRLTEDDLGEYELESIWLEDFPRSRLAKHNPDKLLEILLKQMKSRANVTIKLMKSMDWDFAMVVLRATDTAQHFLFHKKDYLISCYQKVDELIGKIMDTAPEATFFIISDHGFQQLKKILHPDNLLYREGFLTPSREPYNSPMFLLWHLLYRKFRFFLSVLPPDTIRHFTVLKKLLFSGASKNRVLDFSKTKAFCTSEGRGIQINLKGRYERGIIEEDQYEKIRTELIRLFSELRDPETGEKYIKKAYCGDELYGKDAYNPLDIVLDLKKGYSSCEGLRLSNSFIDNLRFQLQNKSIPVLFKDDTVARSGDHAQYGIFFAYGKNIKPGYIINSISVADVLPQVFTVLGIFPLSNLDGKIHEDIFIEKPKLKMVDWKSDESDKKILLDSEKRKIQELQKKLKSLKNRK